MMLRSLEKMIAKVSNLLSLYFKSIEMFQR
jgi:hypothetical protein